MREHLDLLVPALAVADIDVLLLGRAANARWVSGADALWLSGTRPFAPGCVVVREPLGVHLLSTTDDGVPADVVPFDHLFPISWNPVNLMAALAAVPGLAGARRIGVDSMTPTMAQLLAATFPDAELVDGEVVLRAVRRVKSPSDVAAIRAAVELAEECLRRVLEAAIPGVTERALVGIYDEHMAARGVSTPAFEGSFVAVNGTPRTLAGDRPLERGDLVHLRAGVLRDGWEGWLSRSTVCGEGPSGRQHAGFDHWARRHDRPRRRVRSRHARRRPPRKRGGGRRGRDGSRGAERRRRARAPDGDLGGARRLRRARQRDRADHAGRARASHHPRPAVPLNRLRAVILVA